MLVVMNKCDSCTLQKDVQGENSQSGVNKGEKSVEKH